MRAASMASQNPLFLFFNTDAYYITLFLTMGNRTDVMGLIAPLLLVVLLLFIPQLALLYTKYLWLETLSYSSVFVTILSTQLTLFFATVLLLSFSLLVNVYIAARPNPIKKDYYVAILVLSLMFGISLSSSWPIILRYLNQVPFDILDPVFSKDVGFFVFSLPFYRLLQSLAFTVVVISMIAVTVVYRTTGDITITQRQITQMEEDYRIKVNSGPNLGGELHVSDKVKSHLSLLGALFFMILGYKHALDKYGVLYSSRGVIFGAGYTDLHVALPAFGILMVLSVVVAIVLLLTSLSFKRKQGYGIKIPIAAVVLYLLVTIIGLGVYPEIIQQYKVSPNEISLEEVYIQRNINYTKMGFNLNDVDERMFSITQNLTEAIIKENEPTIKNIRLWDWRPIKQTLSQMQEIRSYYDFNDVDVDRYTINGTYTQVLLSAREMAQDQLSATAKTWVNERLLYTHGYGLVMVPVNVISEDGLPEYIIKDIPPKTTSDLTIERPEIYYGEKTHEFVIVNTKTEEFDYPSGDENKYTMYGGTGGVLMDSAIKKLAMAMRFGNVKLLLSDYITPESRVMFYRAISERVQETASFLLYDSDPYVVTSNGKLYWILDAYTHTDKYPYSTPHKNLNYIRNSVKVVIDAYNGDTSYYVIDPTDPLIKTYMTIFPQLFKPFDQFPEGLKEHIRYPIDLFMAQVEVYSTYHMSDSVVFYNKEDKWAIPNEIYGQGVKQRIEAYYMIMLLPGETKPEFMLMMPFTPEGRDNLIAWMGARSDENYGQLILYKFSKEYLLYGPMQIEARIDQDAEISKQLTLWSGAGSNVIRGNLLVIPLGDTLLYVEPLYIHAGESMIPELKRVIVAHGTKVVMEKTLDAALSRLFETVIRTLPAEGERTQEELIKSAVKHYDNAEECLRLGNWSCYGEELQKVRETLGRMEAPAGTG